jgi:hypothetical protein
MVLHQKPTAAEVAEALAMTLEREDPTGAPWCPPRDAAVLRHWVTDRSRELGGGIRRVVRLVRLARLADGRDYVRFIYARVPSLRTQHFKQALEKAAGEGRLIASIAELTANGVRLKESSLQTAAADAFEIDYVQMPRLAALLDILHNALGYIDVAELLAPVLVAGAPTVPADNIARTLQSKLNAWLSERLGSADHLRQAQIIRAFLTSRGRVDPEAIDDESILAFWTIHAPVEGNDGFRLYGSAARALLRYRKALRDAMTEAQIQEAVSLGDGSDRDSVDLERVAPTELTANTWQSPLVLLAAPPADAIKWLNRKERLQLLNYLGGPRPDASDADAASEIANDEETGPDTALCGGERFDLRLLRTLLRADVFGAAQSSIVARLRKRAAAQSAIEQILAPIGGEAYDDCATAYASVREQMELQALAALIALMEGGAGEALILLRHLGGRTAVDAIMAVSRSNVVPLHAAGPQPSIELDDDSELEAMVADGLVDRIAAVLPAAASQPDALLPESTRELIAQARAAARKVNRVGFRREDRTDPSMLLSLRSAVAAVIDVLAELDRLGEAFAGLSHREHAIADRELFAAAFSQIYCPRADG